MSVTTILDLHGILWPVALHPTLHPPETRTSRCKHIRQIGPSPIPKFQPQGSLKKQHTGLAQKQKQLDVTGLLAQKIPEAGDLPKPKRPTPHAVLFSAAADYSRKTPLRPHRPQAYLRPRDPTRGRVWEGVCGGGGGVGVKDSFLNGTPRPPRY